MADFNLFIVSVRILVIRTLFTSVWCDDVVIETPVGKIRGQVKNITQGQTDYSVTEFLGIPYAESTSGSRRFKKPEKKGSFSDVFNATNEFSFCPLDDQYLPGLENLPYSEDCLLLNVIVPGVATSASSFPVMIWIYGGGFQAGLQYVYVAPGFSARNQVILVTMNYRMSIYGFLASRHLGLYGNYGLWDQHMAIKWVHDNIASFGGDPQRVVLFGESAGAASVLYQAMYKGNKGLFQGVIAQSGSPNAPWAFDETPLKTFANFLEKTNCSNLSSKETLDCLQTQDIKVLQPILNQMYFLPVYDGDFITVPPKEFFTGKTEEAKKVLKDFGNLNVILGFNSYEIFPSGNMSDSLDISRGLSMGEFNSYISWFLRSSLNYDDTCQLPAVLNQYYPWQRPDDRYTIALRSFDFRSDTLFILPLLDVASAHAREGGTGNVYMYLFDHRPSFSQVVSYVNGSVHADEIPFVLGLPPRLMTLIEGTEVPQEEIGLSNTMMAYWTQFAKSGNPNSDSLTKWETFSLDKQEYIVFQANKTELEIRERPRAKSFYFWKTFVPNISCKCSDDTISGVARAHGRYFSLFVLPITYFVFK